MCTHCKMPEFILVIKVLAVIMALSIVLEAAGTVCGERCLLQTLPVLTGTPGNNGAPGEPGPKGEVGADGRNGLDGAPGLQGPTGLKGSAGQLGPRGPQGPKGETGSAGSPGQPGMSGMSGEQEPTGLQGEPGMKGNIGEQGPFGPRGPVGPSGVSGMNGSDGECGPVGPVGLQGLAGAQGPPGRPGLNGTTGPPGTAHDAIFEQLMGDILGEVRNQLVCKTKNSKNIPATSCTEIYECNSTLPSGYYWINTTTGAVQVYCLMETNNCGNITVGWRRVAYFDMTNASNTCPQGLTYSIFNSTRMCTRSHIGSVSCSSVTFPTHGVPYTKVCGRARGYQYF